MKITKRVLDSIAQKWPFWTSGGFLLARASSSLVLDYQDRVMNSAVLALPRNIRSVRPAFFLKGSLYKISLQAAHSFAALSISDYKISDLS